MRRIGLLLIAPVAIGDGLLLGWALVDAGWQYICRIGQAQDLEDS